MHTEAFKQPIGDQPARVRTLAREFPLGTTLRFRSGQPVYLLGWTVDDCLILSFVDPFKDYEGAMQTLMWVNAAHFRRVTTR